MHEADIDFHVKHIAQKLRFQLNTCQNIYGGVMQMRKTMKGMDMPIYIVFHNYCVSQPDKLR
jgi:hypothetical protein